MKKFNNLGATGSENIIPFSNGEEQFPEPKEEAKIFYFQAEKLKRMTPEEKKSHAGDLYKGMPLENRKETMAELSEYKLDRNQKGHFLPNHELAAIQANKDFIETQAAEYQNQFKTDKQRDFEQLSSHEPVNNWDKLSFDERQKLGEQGIRDSQDYAQFLEENIARSKESNKISGDPEKNTDKAVTLKVPDDVLASIIANNPIDKFSYSEEKGGMKKQSEKAMIDEIGSVVGESFSELPERLQKDYLDQVKTYLNGKNNGLALDAPKFADINKVRQDEERRLGGVFNAEENGSIKSLTEDYNSGKISEEVYAAELDRMSKLSNEVADSSEQFITEAQRDAAAEKAEKSFFKHPIKTLKRWGATAMKATAVFVGSGFAVGVMNTTIAVAKENDNQKAEHTQKIKEENEQRGKIRESYLDQMNNEDEAAAAEKEKVNKYDGNEYFSSQEHKQYAQDYFGNEDGYFYEHNDTEGAKEAFTKLYLESGGSNTGQMDIKADLANRLGMNNTGMELGEWSRHLESNAEEAKSINDKLSNLEVVKTENIVYDGVVYSHGASVGEGNTLNVFQSGYDATGETGKKVTLRDKVTGVEYEVMIKDNCIQLAEIAPTPGVPIEENAFTVTYENISFGTAETPTPEPVESVTPEEPETPPTNPEEPGKPPVAPEEPEVPPTNPEEPEEPPVTPEEPGKDPTQDINVNDNLNEEAQDTGGEHQINTGEESTAEDEQQVIEEDNGQAEAPPVVNIPTETESSNTVEEGAVTDTTGENHEEDVEVADETETTNQNNNSNVDNPF